MANPLRGEVSVRLAGRTYTLRPTFHILCQLEQRLGLPLPRLLRQIREKGLLASEILMILAIATRHDGSQPFETSTVLDLPAERIDLHGLMPQMAEFLMQAAVAEECEGLLELAYTRLGLLPEQFWNLTWRELKLLLRAVQPREPAYPALPEVEALARRFPDMAA